VCRDVPRARRSLVREEGTCIRQNLKPFVVDPVGPNPTRQGLATHRKRVLRGASEFSTPRSVDSECAGRGNPASRDCNGKPTSWDERKATSLAPDGLASGVPRGISPGHVHKGVRPGTWENPEVSAIKSRFGLRVTNKSRPTGKGRRHPVGAKQRAQVAVPPSEGNEARQDGPRGVVAPQ